MEISVSYAVIYMDAKSGKFLIVHPTHETYWSLPKGGMEEADGGDGAKAATRELFEETAIKAAPAALKYGGRHDYYRAGRNGKTKNKDLCIYLYETDAAMKTSEMTCASMVHSAPGAPFPENDDFKYIEYGEIGRYFHTDGERALKAALRELGMLKG
ncbi:NUDIX hydrolase [uncultured Cloacibacillus sp.]|uniref:NUDIX hydrolase n=1 Tax=uncultured Cloacibacillus sp. TaxID=889794 RepID=UPI0025FD4140|nr:NUDIX hydrolase [uncultured Cloacibacillus sp.]